jgi:SAM-dependent methyltransferase
MSLIRLAKCGMLINARHKKYSLLDVGCRTMALKTHLKGCTYYLGTDLMPSKGVRKCDLNSGLKGFRDNSFDVVVVLDVLEHLDDPFFVLSECIRVAKKTVYVSLPNMFYIQFRINLLFGKGISGKYNFPTHQINDRHKWFLSYEEANSFIKSNTHKLSYKVFPLIPQRGRLKYIIEPIHRFLAKFFPNLLVYAALYEIKK